MSPRSSSPSIDLLYRVERDRSKSIETRTKDGVFGETIRKNGVAKVLSASAILSYPRKRQKPAQASGNRLSANTCGNAYA
eukprot:scaffold3827_cov179-Cylindrotheca_fusiformis.AAC.20